MKKDELIPVNENGQVEVVESREMTLENGQTIIGKLTNAQNFSYSSLDENALTEDEKIDYFNLIDSKGIALSDMINKTFEVSNIYVEAVDTEDMNTGKSVTIPRIILVAPDFKTTYTCASHGILSSLQRVFARYGEPQNWKEPKKFTVGQEKTRKGYNVLTLRLAH